MAPFTQQAVDDQDLDWWILSMGGVCLYHRMALLDVDIEWLRSRKYEVKLLDAGLWASEHEMHAELSSTFTFVSSYGNNLDALSECMREDVEVPASGGLVIVLNRYDRFANGPGAAQLPETKGVAYALLDLLAQSVRSHLLTGGRLIVLVQSDDPRVSFEGLGAVGARWNSQEWLKKDRGL